MLCVALASCKKDEIRPEKTWRPAQLHTNGLSSLPVFNRFIWAHGQPDNLYISGDTLSMTDQYANFRYNKQTGALIKGSAANDLGTFYAWLEFSDYYQFVKIVKRRDKNGNRLNLYCFPEGGDFDPGPASYPLDFKPHGAGVTGYVAIQKLNAQYEFVWAKLNGAYQINKNLNASFDIDAAGNLYICGTGPGASLEMPATSSLGFIQKADNNGKLIWQTRLTEQFPTEIVVDRAGNSYFIADNKIIKVDASGKLVAKKAIPVRPNTKSATITGLTIDKKDNLYISGRFQYVFPNGKTAMHSYIQKADVNGNSIWYVSSSSAQTEQNDVNKFFITDVIVDDNGDIYAACNSFGTVTIAPGNKITTDGDSPYVIKLSQPGY